MSMDYVEDQTFRQVDYTASPLPKGNYEACEFIDCNFSKADLSHVVFIDCSFHECDMSMAKVHEAAFRNAQFKDCKLLGIHFDHCNEFLFEVAFDNCRLDLASFYQRALPKTDFTACSLKEADFVEADLRECSFARSDLSGAVFERTKLEKADFRGALNYNIDLEINSVGKARFSRDGLHGLLGKYNLKIS